MGNIEKRIKTDKFRLIS